MLKNISEYSANVFIIQPPSADISKRHSKKKSRIVEIQLEQLCRAWRLLQHEPLVAKFRFDTAENDLSELEILDNFGDFDYVVMNLLT